MSETIYRKLKDLKKLPNNPRTILDDDFKRLCASVQNNADYFKARPLILSDRTGELVIIAGNQRYEAAKRLKLREVPTHLIENLTEEREKEIIIRDNVANGSWDFELLDSGDWDLQDLTDWGVVMPDFEAIEDDGEPQDAEAQIDKAAELNKKWKVCKGDLFSIGSHRLLCGDSTKREDVERLMDGEKADLIVTDPPYGVDYDGGTTKREKLAGDKTPALYFPFLLTAKEFLNPHAALYLFYADGNAAVTSAVTSAGFLVRSNLIWNKNQAQFGALSAQYKQKHEPFLYCHLKGKAPQWFGATNEVSVWEFDRANTNNFHPTQKPVELIQHAIGNSSKQGQLLFEGFAGSGTTLVAAQNLNRKCYAIEISENYCAVILQRMTDAFPSLEIKRITQSEAANG